MAGARAEVGHSTRGARRAPRAILAIGICALVGCGRESPATPAAPTPPGPPAEVLAISSTVAQGTVGAAVPQALTVRVVDAGGRGVPNVPVRWVVAPNTGQLTPPEAVTDAKGETSATWTLGRTAGTQRVTAVATTVAGPDSVTFTGTASAGPPTRVDLTVPVEAVSVDDTLPATVRVFDAFDNPIPVGGAAITVADSSVLRAESGGVLRGLRAGTTYVRAGAGANVDSVRVRVYRPLRAVAVGTGVAFSCALAADDARVYCWGSDPALGLNALVYRAAPQPVAATVTFRALTVGPLHACALTAAGEAWCWGSNTDGALGDGTRIARSTAVRAAPELRFSVLTAGGGQTCGLDLEGRAFCWGRNASGELGNGTVSPFSVTPTPVVGSVPTVGSGSEPSAALRFAGISAGATHTCALASGPVADSGQGAVSCWGTGGAWLGLGTPVVRGTPVPAPRAVAGTRRFTRVSAGTEQTCALDTDARVYCWGRSAAGADVPQRVFADRPFTDVSAGGVLFTCAVDAETDAYCLGVNTVGQLGSDDPAWVSGAAVRVAGRGYTAISAGSGFDRHHACAIAQGVVRCWGANFMGQTGQYAQNEVTSGCGHERCVLRPTPVQAPEASSSR